MRSGVLEGGLAEKPDCAVRIQDQGAEPACRNVSDSGESGDGRRDTRWAAAQLPVGAVTKTFDFATFDPNDMITAPRELHRRNRHWGQADGRQEAAGSHFTAHRS